MPALLPRTPLNTARAIQQSINATHFFDGTLPTADSVLANYTMYKYPIGNTGGLFYFDATEAIVISQFNVDLGAAANISLYIVNLDPTSVKDVQAGNVAQPTVGSDKILIEQVTAQQFVTLDESKFKTVLLPYQALQLITTASGQNQYAQCIGALERTFIR